MNRGKVRQPGTVAQRYLSLRLIGGTRHAEHSLSLTGDLGVDGNSVRDAVAGLRAVLPELADDPLLLLPTEVRSSRNVRDTPLPPSEPVIDEVLAAAAGLDLVGIYAAGPVWRGFANSEGQRNWHATNTFNLQWSLYHRADKAVKTGHAGFAWDAAAFEHKMGQARERLALISRPPANAGAGQVPRISRAVGDGGNRRAAVLGRFLGTRAGDQAKRAREDADRRVARSPASR